MLPTPSATHKACTPTSRDSVSAETQLAAYTTTIEYWPPTSKRSHAFSTRNFTASSLATPTRHCPNQHHPQSSPDSRDLTTPSPTTTFTSCFQRSTSTSHKDQTASIHMSSKNVRTYLHTYSRSFSPSHTPTAQFHRPGELQTSHQYTRKASELNHATIGQSR